MSSNLFTMHDAQQHETQYDLKARPHDKLLIPKTADLNDRDFIVRMLYKSRY